MSVGGFVRGLFGPHERAVSAIYRAIYLDLDSLVGQILAWRASATQILEVGCGEGAVTELLRCAYPQAEITAIDITPRLGRLYRGATDRVHFRRCGVADIAAERPGTFDLVILSDVYHHVPVALRAALLAGIRTALAQDGDFVFKDWRRTGTPIHLLCWASDRWLTGDRVVYASLDEMRGALRACFGAQAIRSESVVAPWRNNVAFRIRTSNVAGP